MKKSTGGTLRSGRSERVGEQAYTTYEYSINKKLDIKLDLGPINIPLEVEKQLEENSSKIKDELIKAMRKQNKISL
ncbi:MAG: hypothetical protein KC646_10160 [Candidatus Cloacimonetes bacterium]|nr:hypothetical protein [Candidatus Cloacimonadota bacterium]